MKRKNREMIGSRLIQPIQHFINQEKSGVIVLALAFAAAMIIANSPINGAYYHFFEHKLGFVFNGEHYLYYSLHHWINDGLMSMFFFVVGLELKREFISGELNDIRKALLSVCAALAGMAVPAVIYLSLNAGAGTSAGWGIPMTTDIAFSLAIISMLSSKVPLSVKIFLTTLAIVDDLGAVLVIAFFYTSEISFTNMAIGMVFLLVMYIANKAGIKNVMFYGILGIGGVWTAFLMSGIHATIAAVLAAFMIPADSHISKSTFLSHTYGLLKRLKEVKPGCAPTLEHEQVEIIDNVISSSQDAVPPLQRLEHSMHKVVSFVIMPVFAFANAGISFYGLNFSTAFSTNIALGVMLGLLIGKPLGIVLSTILLTKLKITPLPETLTLRRILGVGFLSSIGFTMSIFISTLAFTDEAHLMQAKLGIFAASIAGGIIGYCLLNGKQHAQPQ